jgi:peptidoglycan/xylan/chitin deacetylase (PgdA/CDA1 family)
MKILMFHDIREFDHNFFPERYKHHSFLSDTQFKKGIEVILNNISPPDNIIYKLQNPLFNKKFILTFDDGLKDYLWVAEYLAKKNISAIFFVPIGIIKEKKFIDSNLIQFLLSTKYKQEIQQFLYAHLLDKGFLKKKIDSFKISKWKKNVWSEEDIFITRVLRENFDYKSRNNILKKMALKYLDYDFKKLHDNFYLNMEDLNKIKNLGHTIGSHGYYSFDLTKEKKIVIKKELNSSINSLNKITSTGYKSISWPNGGYNKFIGLQAKKLNFELGFGTENVNSKSLDIFNIERKDATKMKIFS